MPTIRERLDADLKDAMRAKDEVKLTTIRAIKSAIKYKEVEGENKVLDDAGILGVLTSEVKKRREASAEFKAANRADLAEKEEKELVVLQGYLPTQLTAEQLTAEVAKATSVCPSSVMLPNGGALYGTGKTSKSGSSTISSCPDTTDADTTRPAAAIRTAAPRSATRICCVVQLSCHWWPSTTARRSPGSLRRPGMFAASRTSAPGKA